MKAIILAAGRGSRMKELTDDAPKCLVSLHGRPLIEWQLSALRQAGLSEIGIVTGYSRECLAGLALTEFHNPRWEETNMVASLACASQWLENDVCIVSYSDIFYDFTAVRALIACPADLAVTYDPNWLQIWAKRFADPLSDAETFRFSANGRLTEIGNRPRSLEDIEGQYMGLLRITPAGWGEMQRLRELLPPAEADRMHMTGTLQRVITASRVPIHVLPYDGIWGEVDTGEDLAAYQ